MTGIAVSFIFSWRMALVILSLSPLLIFSGIITTYNVGEDVTVGQELIQQAMINNKLVKSLNCQDDLVESLLTKIK